LAKPKGNGKAYAPLRERKKNRRFLKGTDVGESNFVPRMQSGGLKSGESTGGGWARGEKSKIY